MKTILVVDDLAIFRDPIAASLRLAGYETLAAADGEAALSVALARQPDLVLLDIAMPKMDGLTFLRHLRSDEQMKDTPVILLTAMSDKAQVLAAKGLGITDYLLKSRFRLKDLLERIKRQLEGGTAQASPSASAPVIVSAAGASARQAMPAAAPPAAEAGAGSASAPPRLPGGGRAAAVPRLLSRDECARKAEGVVQGKTLSGVITQIISVASSPRGDAAQLSSLIARDAMMSARVLQAANSAAYTSSTAIVTEIPDAIRKIGFMTVRNIAAALGIFDAMTETDPDGFNPIRCWQHSFAVAQLCERLALEKNAEDASVAYVVGLCHDLGEILIHTHFHAEYRQVLEKVQETGRPREQVQREMLGMSHSELTRTVFRCLALPETIREPIEILHGLGRERSRHPLAQVLWMAENYANGAMLASGPESLVAPITQLMCRSAIGSADAQRPDPQALRAEVMCLTAILARLSKADEERVLAPMFVSTPVRVWLARDPGLCSFDPVEAALSSLAEVKLDTRLPSAAEVAGVDGLVVVGRSPEAAGFSAAEVERLSADLRRQGRELRSLQVASAVGGSAVTIPTSLRLSELAGFVKSLVERGSVAA